jgi:hypothetical protein
VIVHRSKLRMTYAVNQEEKTSVVMFPHGQLVGDFLDFVRKKVRKDDLEAVWRDGVLLDNSDCLDGRWWRRDFIFQVVEAGVDPGVDTEVRKLPVTYAIN